MEVQEEFTAIVVIYDHDHSITKQHSEGARRRRSFEKPCYEANLRARAFLKSHIQRLRSCKNKRVFLGAATLGEFEERVIKSWEALGVERQDLFLCAKFIDNLTLSTEGKSFHIVQILLQILSLYPNVKIEHVYVVDDSGAVINALSYYSEFISQDPWRIDPRLNVPVTGITVPIPELEYEMTEVEGRLPRAMLAMQRDVELQVDVCVELPSSERRFIAALQVLENKIDPTQSIELGKNKTTHFQDGLASLPPNKKRFFARSHDGMTLVSTELKQKLEEKSVEDELSLSSSSCSITDIDVVDVGEDQTEYDVKKLFKSV